MEYGRGKGRVQGTKKVMARGTVKALLAGSSTVDRCRRRKRRLAWGKGGIGGTDEEA